MNQEFTVTFQDKKPVLKRPAIQGKELTKDDIGRQVVFTYPHGERDYGVLSSFRDDGAIFVRFKGPTGERCDAERLTWVWG